jgi:hypothetical protein
MIDRMPFGKFKDHPLIDLKPSYVRWLRTIPLYDDLATALERCHGGKFLRRDEEQEPTPEPTLNIGVDFRSMRRKFATKYHPDHGGSVVIMQVVNDVFDTIEQAVAK